MQTYLLSLYQPGGPAPEPGALAAIMTRMGTLRSEMIAAGAFVFASGLGPASAAMVIRFVDGEALTTDGPFVEGREHIGGFTAVRVADQAEAIEWGRKLSAASTLPVEVREMLGFSQAE